uniref:PH domain-containing protein n=2 Tax=Kalmanozyma brasiliensis (strain GHG001) TaxID=1365824 RepID=V5GK58_KALBG
MSPGTAEPSIRVANREAKIETLRLSGIETGYQEVTVAEAVRRAKWAREQAARNQLDAYERSKLEADEKRRRRAVEQQRLLDRERAMRRREEQEWREQQAERLEQEHEIQRRVQAERIAKLRAEAEAKEQLDRELRTKQAARESYRQGRLLELTTALRNENEMDAEARASPILKGWLNLQLEGEVHWKRRWYAVTGRQLILSRSATDRSPKTTIPLDPTRLISVSDQHEDGTMDRTLMLEVQQSASDDRASGLVSESTAKRSYTIHLDTRDAKEEIELVIEAIASL